MWKSILTIALGAALGALLRWFLGLELNNLPPSIPPGTLLANLVGGYVIGAAIAHFVQAPGIALKWRLLIITGFYGGPTTFSTLSTEVVSLLQEGRLGWVAGAIMTHVSGSLLVTLLGLFSMNWMLNE